jgi:cystathionine beta-synthase
MLELGYIEAEKERITVQVILKAKPRDVPAMISVNLHEPLTKAVELKRKFDVSQLPVIEEGHVLGTIHDDTVMKQLLTKEASLTQSVQESMDQPLPTIEAGAEIGELYRQLSGDHNAVVVVHEGKAVGVLTKMDVITHLSKREA